jgi:hypothetical protein
MKTYKGSACKRCGKRERYHANKGCVACLTEGRLTPEGKYLGNACKRCGFNERYVTSGKCTHCTRQRAKKFAIQEAHACGGFPKPPAFVYEPMGTPDFSEDNLRGYLQ